MIKHKYFKFIISAGFIFVMIFSFSSAYADPQTNGGQPIGGSATAQGGTPPVQPNSGTQSGTPASFENPIAYDTVDGVLASFLGAIQGIVAVLAVLMIVVGGIIYITSAGDQGRVDLAKKAVTSAVIGLSLALAAPAFLKEIYRIMGKDTPASAPVASKEISQIILDTLNVLLGVIGTLSILMLVVGGIMYMTAGGDDARADTAKKTIQYAIIGLIVALVSLVIVTQISNIFT